MIEVLFALIAISIRISTQHFVFTTAPSCELANTCNHTWVSLCGQDQNEFTNRLFVDECDMHEYNCDNNKAYIQAELKTCLYKCTRQLLEGTSNSKSSTHKLMTDPLTTSVDTTTVTVVTPNENNETSGTEPVTTQATMSTVDSSIATTTTENTTSEATTLTEETSSENNISSTESQSSVAEESTTISTETNTIPITNETTTIESENSTVDSTSAQTELESETTTKPTEEIFSTTSMAQNCTSNSQDCFVPSTWETTHPSENRDFFQILRERFGDKFEIIRDPIYIPKPVGRMGRKIGRNGEVFIAGQHKETNNKNYFGY